MSQLSDKIAKLDSLKLDLLTQIQAINSDKDVDMKKMHKEMTFLAAKYSDSVDLVNFIVFINDKLETKNNLFSEIVSEVIQDLIEIKKDTIIEVSRMNKFENDSTIKKLLTDPFAVLKDLKVIVGGTVIILTLIGYLTHDTAVKDFKDIFNKPNTAKVIK